MTALSDGQLPGKPLRVPKWWRRILIGRNPSLTLVRLVLLVVACVVLFKGVLIPVRVTGKSMEPTYRDGRVNFINRLAYRRAEPRRGDVVALQAEDSHLILLKRIVGLPGERIGVRRGRIFINGQILEEKYMDRFRSVPFATGEIVLGEHEYFAIGDNRRVSVFGVVERRDIVGKVLF
jgi:signal peptidase I